VGVPLTILVLISQLGLNLGDWIYVERSLCDRGHPNHLSGKHELYGCSRAVSVVILSTAVIYYLRYYEDC